MCRLRRKTHHMVTSSMQSTFTGGLNHEFLPPFQVMSHVSPPQWGNLGLNILSICPCLKIGYLKIHLFFIMFPIKLAIVGGYTISIHIPFSDTPQPYHIVYHDIIILPNSLLAISSLYGDASKPCDVPLANLKLAASFWSWSPKNATCSCWSFLITIMCI